MLVINNKDAILNAFRSLVDELQNQQARLTLTAETQYETTTVGLPEHQLIIGVKRIFTLESRP